MHLRDDPRCLPRSIRSTPSASFRCTATSVSSHWARCSSPSPAARRSTPISAISAETHPARLARARAAGAAHQLFRPGRAGARASRGDREPVLSPRAGIASAAARRAGDRGHRDREPGRHHRRLFAGEAGDPAWPPAAARYRAHLGGIFRTDLYPARQHRAADRRDAAGRAVPHIERARFGLWHRRHHNHGGRRHPRLHRDLEAVALAAWQAAPADGAARRSSTRRSSPPICSSSWRAPGCRCCSASSW